MDARIRQRHASCMRLLLALFLLLAPATVRSQDTRTEVDLQLVLLVDVSRSMTARELEIQRRGYAEALQSDAVFKAIQSGLLQRIALTYVEWAGGQEVVVDWTLIETKDDLQSFAEQLSVRLDPALRRTAISEALIFGMRSLDTSPFDSFRKVIDISGDGPNNQGRPVLVARDKILSQGIVINGLPLMTREGMGLQWHLEGLDIYYRTCVIGGPGSFAIPVKDWNDFAAAVRRKLVLEIAGLTPPPTPVPAHAFDPDPTDCLIGEKIWQNRRLDWQIP